MMALMKQKRGRKIGGGGYETKLANNRYRGSYSRVNGFRSCRRDAFRTAPKPQERAALNRYIGHG